MSIGHERRKIGAALLLAALSVTGLWAHPSTAAPATAQPAETISYYVANTSRDRMAKLGCLNSSRWGRMTMFFGAPVRVGNGYGATLWAARNQSTSGIAELIRQFVRGYVACRPSTGYKIRIGVGTSNSTIDGRTDAWLVNHGRAWASMVRSLADWSARTYGGAARVSAAWDAEPSWSTVGKARAWMHGYQSIARPRPLFANFSADGCSWMSHANAACNNGWRQHDLWDLAWRRPPSLPIPLIYATSGVNALQWQRISAYGARYQNRAIFFYGTMTQSRACRQRGGCHRTDNTPRAAQRQLLDALNAGRLTGQAGLQTMTDMEWYS